MLGRWSKLSGGLAGGVLGIGWAVGFATPSSLAGALAWSVAVFGVLFGLGALVRRRLDIDLGPGEQMVLGTVVWIAVTGPLIALGVCSRTPMIALAAIGSVAAVFELTTHPPTARPDRVVVVLWCVLAVVLGIQLMGMVSTRGNPYDDQSAYTAFVRRLLDCGDLVEPYSFRRISAYGGHTSLLALAALRGDVESTDLLDRGIFQWIGVLVVIDIARRRRLHLAAICMVVVFVLGIWDMSINSAATWTGFSTFIAAYGFASREDLPRRTAVMLAFGACAAACTLRQNYLLPAGLMCIALLYAHARTSARETSWRTALRSERRTILLAVAVAAAIVVPYMVAAWISNRTFLYPLLVGTVSPDAPLRPTGVTISDELGFFVTTLLTADPIRIWWLLVPFMVMARDRRALQPWRAFALASLLGFLFLIHSFMLSDPVTLWRYAYGFMTPLAVVFLVEISTRLPFLEAEQSEPPLRLGAVAILLVWFAVAAQLVATRGAFADRLDDALDNAKASVAVGTNKIGDESRYERLQAKIPAGEPFAAMVDDPYLFDFARNQIFNLDLPGFASPPPGLPSYLGAERWRTYFLQQGIRYIAYVDATHSSYLYRRNSWLHRLFSEGEVWRFIGARLIDTTDTLAALSRTSTVLFDDDGLRLIDLGTHAEPPPTTPDPPEPERRDAFVRRLSEQEFGNNAWQLTTRGDVVFRPDGLGPGELHVEPGRGRRTTIAAGLWAWVTSSSGSLPPYRWLADRTHIRVKGRERQRVRIRAWADVEKLKTIPSIRLVIDGVEIGRRGADADGYITIEGDVACRGWCDLYLFVSSTSEYWVPPDVQRVVKLVELAWDER